MGHRRQCGDLEETLTSGTERDRGTGLKEWPRKAFGQLWAGGRCAAEGLLGPELLAAGQLETGLWDEGAELLTGRAALTTNMLQENKQPREPSWGGPGPLKGRVMGPT